MRRACDATTKGKGRRLCSEQDATGGGSDASNGVDRRAVRGDGGGPSRDSSDSRRLIIELSTFVEDVPFEFVRKVSGPGAVAEAGHVEGSSATTRHGDVRMRLLSSKGVGCVEEKAVEVVVETIEQMSSLWASMQACPGNTLQPRRNGVSVIAQLQCAATRKTKKNAYRQQPSCGCGEVVAVSLS